MTRQSANQRKGARPTVHYHARVDDGPRTGTLLIDDERLCVVGPACKWSRADGSDGGDGFELTYLGTCDEAGKLIKEYPDGGYTYKVGPHYVRNFRVVAEEASVLERYVARQRAVKVRRAAA